MQKQTEVACRRGRVPNDPISFQQRQMDDADPSLRRRGKINLINGETKTPAREAEHGQPPWIPSTRFSAFIRELSNPPPQRAAPVTEHAEPTRDISARRTPRQLFADDESMGNGRVDSWRSIQSAPQLTRIIQTCS
ncbi:hypothetical protein LDENG_00067740 [Lucifuga dentata]|nr:hypothetical protein LDENG_00067740 [Lucifuga dentata]